MNKLGWEVHSFDHEDANGQFEFDFAYADVMTMADRFVVWRMMMKELARKHGLEATMMAKPYADRTGSGAHFNMSLADVKTGKNISGDASRQARLRSLQARLPVPRRLAEARRGDRRGELPDRQFLQAPDQDRLDDRIHLGADLHFLRRQQPDAYVPRAACSGRISKASEHGHSHINLSSTRWECRAVDPSTNPYLAAAMFLGAGLDGIEQDLDPGDPQLVNMYELSDQELEKRGIRQLPKTLLEAVTAFEAGRSRPPRDGR